LIFAGYSVLAIDVMESVLGRYRNLTILVGVLFLQVLGLAVQVKRSAEAEHTRLIRIWAVDAITPFERVLVWGQDRSSNLWHNYFFLRGVRAENRQLKEQIEQMRLEQVRLSEDAAQARRLQSLLAFKEQFIAKTIPAQVIGSSGSDLSQSIYIDKGSDDGIAQDMAVITARGIVGKVLRVFPSTSLVLMINDQSSGVGAFLEKSRLQGVLRGSPNGELILDRVMSDEQVAAGDTLLSSGGDQIFPKGLPVGTVTKVSPGKELFLSVKVKPAADLSRLEEVLVVTERQEHEPVAESSGRVRAADILAQRLPSVPNKPATVAGATRTAENGAALPDSGNSANPQSTGASQPPAGNAMKPTGGAQATTGSNSAGSGGVHSVAAAGQPGAGEVLKKAVEKVPSADSSADPGTTKTAGSKPDNSAPKPAVARPKTSGKQSTPQPSTNNDDTPH
jgi:rod shape-determining protein MreC